MRLQLLTNNCVHVVFHGALSCGHGHNNWSLQSTCIVCPSVLFCFTFSPYRCLVSHRSSLACVTEAFEQEKPDIKGKAKERNDVGPDIVDLTVDGDGHALENVGNGPNLVKKLLTTEIGPLSSLKLTT